MWESIAYQCVSREQLEKQAQIDSSGICTIYIYVCTDTVTTATPDTDTLGKDGKCRKVIHKDCISRKQLEKQAQNGSCIICTLYIYACNMCPRSSDPFYIVTYYMKWVTTSWTNSTDTATVCQRSSAPLYIVTYYIKWVTNSLTHITTAAPDTDTYGTV